MAVQPHFPVPLPFQRYASFQGGPLADLTWQTCFDFTKNDILVQFVRPLQTAPTHRGSYSWSVRARAEMLSYMLSLPEYVHIDPKYCSLTNKVIQVRAQIRSLLVGILDKRSNVSRWNDDAMHLTVRINSGLR